VLAVLVLIAGAAALVGWKYVWPWWRTKPPAPSGAELQVHILDVGPVDGDSILIISPTGRTVLIDAGDAGKEKVVLDALKRYKVQQLDYFIATHPHRDHIGGAAAVLKTIKVLNIIDNGLGPITLQGAAAALAREGRPEQRGNHIEQTTGSRRPEVEIGDAVL
jgi:beta-lactamase superfamily II metal-dependent hydrolase